MSKKAIYELVSNNDNFYTIDYDVSWKIKDCDGNELLNKKITLYKNVERDVSDHANAMKNSAVYVQNLRKKSADIMVSQLYHYANLKSSQATD